MSSILIIFAMAQFLVALVNLLSWPVLLKSENKYQDLVSVLIPARDEEKNIENLINSVTSQNYRNYELLVLDDFSSDKTAGIVTRYCSEKVRLLPGQPLPPGWTGKSWACHQLAQAAKGDYLLFLDADTIIGKDLINNSLNYLEKKNLDLLSLFTGQIVMTTGEKITVPVIQYILLTLLPLFLVEKSPYPSLAAANGQFMLFRGGAYHSFNWHSLVKDSLAEDIVISRLMKQNGLKIAARMGRKQIYCRMYTGFWEAITGFSKNISLIFGNNIFLFIYLFFYFMSFLWLFYDFIPALIAIVLIYAARIFAAILAGENIIAAILLFPAQLVSLACIFGFSVYRGYQGNYSWKNRLVSKTGGVLND